ncbi:uncharacterized protein DUF2568 [Motilibacter rhizosphaerae]|uniref:Uncharacterized protein DUF2568 n=1 Tax=Motilibacter rhizosphaerae TaxID=598652 RepID=A0A4Q7NAZ6_9ACTN|nr:DUF2568 domain-containing protein [Motilibacter rhizosphaerae]RZS80128.1 uncharacterized protein DUF2568 [Motilibacter rhizosphaerae]
MQVVRAGVLAAIFGLELLALACVGRWGWHLAPGSAPGAVLAVVAVLVWAGVWGTFLSPRAQVAIPRAAATAGRAAMVGAAALGGAVSGWPSLAVALVVGWVACAAVEAAV